MWTKTSFSVDRNKGNIDLTVDHRMLSEEGRAEIVNDIKIIKEKAQIMGDHIEAAFTNLPEDIKAQTGDIGEAVLDEIIKSGRSKEEALALLEDPNFQAAILDAANELNQAVENYDPQAELQTSIDQKNQINIGMDYVDAEGNLQMGETVVTQNPNDLPLKAKTVGALADANEYLETVDPKLREAALIGAEVAMGGPVKAAVGWVVGEAINAVAGEEIGKAVDAASDKVTDWAMGEKSGNAEIDGHFKAGGVLGVGIVTGIGMPGRKGSGNRHGDDVDIVRDNKNDSDISQADLQAPYDPNRTRADLETTHGPDNVTSSTNPNNPVQTVNSNPGKGIEVIHGSDGGKAVRVQFNDPVTGGAKVANIPYNKRGLPVFDDHAKYTATIDHSLNYQGQMRKATRDLRDAINLGKVDPNQFTSQQLKQIQSGSSNIKNFTWHHNADSGNMQLIPKNVHDAVRHIGQGSLNQGK